MAQGTLSARRLNKAELVQSAKQIRADIIEMIYHGKSGHPGGSLSIAEILAVLYGAVMKHDPGNPSWEDRDRMVLSKGHAAPALYAILAQCGYFDHEVLKSFRKFGSILQGHPDSKKVPGVEVSTGSLGQGLSLSAGMAWGARKQGKAFRVYCILGDGEIQEGQVWEAAMAIPQFGLNNITAILDYNNLQIDGTVPEIMDVSPVDDKFRAFGWNVAVIDGNDIDAVLAVLEDSKLVDKPTMIIAKTVKGKGVSYFEGKVSSHHIANMSEELLKEAMNEIENRSRS